MIATDPRVLSFQSIESHCLIQSPMVGSPRSETRGRGARYLMRLNKRGGMCRAMQAAIVPDSERLGATK